MPTLDRPAVPEVPQFEDDMEAFLIGAARSRASVHHRNRRPYLAGAVAAVAVIAAVVFGIVQPFGTSSGTHHPTGPAQLASFSVTSHPNGLVTLTLTPGQMRDPDVLRRDLATAGVPALVTSNSVCYVRGPSDLLTQVLGAPQRGTNGTTVWTINPAAIPTGSELSIGYYHLASGFGIHVTLVPAHGSLICGPTPPPPPHR
jgi:hypothetical protein